MRPTAPQSTDLAEQAEVPIRVDMRVELLHAGWLPGCAYPDRMPPCLQPDERAP